jgi:hypothetical protein
MVRNNLIGQGFFRKDHIMWCLWFPIFFQILSCSSDSIVLVEKGKSDYSIVVSAQADSVTLKAAYEFQKYIGQLSGVSLPFISDNENPSGHEIIIGNSTRLTDKGLSEKIAALDEDGFIIQTMGKKLVIAGGKDKGTLYGVYTFLEEYLGCRKYSSKVSFIPQYSDITLKPIDTTMQPAFAYRELHFPDPINDEDYRNWHKLDAKKGKDEWGLFVHTFQTLVPPEKYFKDHPEYFSFLNVQRIPDGQLCLSNQDVFNIVIDGLKERMTEKPGAKYWSVSQNDTFKACECDDCKKLYQEYGGYSGAMIWFVNKVAEKFPDKIISTLAYQYTRSAPVNIKPLENVNIMFCSIECNRSLSLATDSLSASFRKDAEDWCALTDNIFMWDYVVQFRNMVSPFPNLRVLQPNIQYFRDKGMKMMFQQGTGGNISEFYELRQYLIAKLLWNPDADVQVLTDDFLKGYYGTAAGHISQYITTMHDALEQSGGMLGIYGYPYDGIQTYLTPGLIKSYAAMFDQAEIAVRDEPAYLERVKLSRLPLEFAILDISLRNVDEYLTYFKKENGRFTVRQDMIGKLEKFTQDAKTAGITRYWEHGNAPDEYRATVLNYVKNSMQDHLALFKPVELLTESSEKYSVGGGAALTDGLKGVNDYHFNWLGFEGTNLEAIIDLGSEKEIHSIETSFLQDIQSWVFFPLQVNYFGSRDGVTYFILKSVKTVTPPHQNGTIIEDYKARFPGFYVRYVKVVGKNMGTCPSWHPGGGYPAWIFCDEVIVK